MAVENPNTSSQPEPETPGSRPMSRLEIGLMVGSILFFAILISSIFLVRGLEQRRRVKGLLRRVEEGNMESKDQHQTPRENNVTEQGQQKSAETRHMSIWRKRGARFLSSMKSKKTGEEPQASSDTTTGHASGDISPMPADNPQPKLVTN
ncbi:hypothetical protein NW762_009889 [Fusarium torreyae]|uniref:Uncharacterized protein n=1 Tax=Fusarium torreyae TaxID=1237075 RepID=A0A9W8RW81_9HYPO|nr:hypothetical protein NW762_009889 [Fusarium torreyae]